MPAILAVFATYTKLCTLRGYKRQIFSFGLGRIRQLDPWTMEGCKEEEQGPHHVAGKRG